MQHPILKQHPEQAGKVVLAEHEVVFLRDGAIPDNNPQLIWNLSLDTLPDTFVDYPGHVDLLDATDADSEPEASPATPVETPVETSGCT